MQKLPSSPTLFLGPNGQFITIQEQQVSAEELPIAVRRNGHLANEVANRVFILRDEGAKLTLTNSRDVQIIGNEERSVVSLNSCENVEISLPFTAQIEVTTCKNIQIKITKVPTDATVEDDIFIDDASEEVEVVTHPETN